MTATDAKSEPFIVGSPESPERVIDLAHLMRLVDERRAVWQGLETKRVYGCLNRPKPAAVVVNWSAAFVFQLLATGLFVYEASKKETPVW